MPALFLAFYFNMHCWLPFLSLSRLSCGYFCLNNVSISCEFRKVLLTSLDISFFLYYSEISLLCTMSLKGATQLQ